MTRAEICERDIHHLIKPLIAACKKAGVGVVVALDVSEDAARQFHQFTAGLWNNLAPEHLPALHLFSLYLAKEICVHRFAVELVAHDAECGHEEEVPS